jgi:hypothetical protein
MRFSSTLFLLLTLLASHHTLATKTKPRSSCVAFVPEPPAYYTHGWGTPADEEAGTEQYRISKGIDCTNPTKPCPAFTAEGYVSSHPTLNISTDSPDAIFAVIRHTWGERQHEFKSVTTKVLTMHLRENDLAGFRGWMSYSPSWVCTEGTLSSCRGDIANGTAVKACTPLRGVDVGVPHFTESNGTISEYDFNCNPAMTPAARRGENPMDCRSEGEDIDVKSEGGSLRSIGFSLLAVGLGLATLRV